MHLCIFIYQFLVCKYYHYELLEKRMHMHASHLWEVSHENSSQSKFIPICYFACTLSTCLTYQQLFFKHLISTKTHVPVNL